MLYPLDVESRLASHIRKLSRELGLRLLQPAELLPEARKRLIILGGGTPDDYAIALVAHACDGEETVAITTPMVPGRPSEPRPTRLEAIRSLKELLSSQSRLSKAVLVIDRDRDPLSDITGETVRVLTKYGIRPLEQPREFVGGWVKAISCQHGAKTRFDFLLLVQGMGLNQVYASDTVEVHLLEAGRQALGDDLIRQALKGAKDPSDRQGRADPKLAWGKLDKDEHWEVFRWLDQHPDEIRRFFRQHYEALRLLREG